MAIDKKLTVYEIVTDRIIKSLESGTVPWRKPWTSRAPMNLVSRKPYRGINVFLLGDRKSPYWLSFKQMVAKGGKLKENDKKASIAVFWKFLDGKELDEKGKPTRIPLLRYYNVFNLDQIEGIEAPQEEALEFTPIESADKIVRDYTFRNGPACLEIGSQACYSPKADEVRMPAKESFVGIPEYYSTLFHELIHSTGHKTRLGRFDYDAKPAMFGSESYSKEELVAEIGASFLMAETGIEVASQIQNSEAYIAGWLSALKNDKKFILSASGQAQKAVDFMLDRKFNEEEE